MAKCTKAELAQKASFDNFYQLSTSTVFQKIEKHTCGCCYGGNSWTTKKQAEYILKVLELSTQSSLLDLGAGAGWPGLYLSSMSGCSLTLVDLPETGLKIAIKRSIRDKISEKVATLVSDASQTPFLKHSFNAISHSDLLCCLFSKAQVLTECRRIIKTKGKMAFTVISVKPGLSNLDHQKAILNSPEFIQAEEEYNIMLQGCGWQIIDQVDLSEDYLESCRLQIEADYLYQDELVELLGEKETSDRISAWNSKLEVIAQGLVRRDLFVCIPDRF